MTDKSYVTMESAVCPVCGKAHDTGSILMDTRLRPRFGHRTATHYALCPEDKAKHEEGFVALVEVTNGRDRMKPADAIPTGRVLHIRAEVADHLFTPALHRKNDALVPFCYIDPDAFTAIVERAIRDGALEADTLTREANR